MTGAPEERSPAGAAVRDISPAAAEPLVREGVFTVLDVRTPEEYSGLGHIPGAILLPVDLVACGAATLPRDGKPLLVCCEHGVRSAFAANLLARAGFAGVTNLAGGMAAWRGEREHSEGDPFASHGPSSWLIENAGLLPRGGRALDVACGRGRHALLLAAAGLEVDALDSDAARIAELRDTAERLRLPVRAEVRDLEAPGADLGEAAYDVAAVFHFLHRPLFPALVRSLRPGGLLLYETFHVDQAGRGRPTSPKHLLRTGELDDLVRPLEVLRRRQGEFHGRVVSAVAARKAG